MKTAFGPFTRAKVFVLLALACGLVLALLFTCSPSVPEIASFGDLRQHGISLSTADLITKRNEVYVVVALAPAKSIGRFLRPGRPIYAFDKAGRLVASTANDADDPEFYLEWEGPQNRPLTESEVAKLSTASEKEFTAIVTGWDRLSGSL